MLNNEYVENVLQQHLDQPILTPTETINKLQLCITELEKQIQFYENNELEHQEKIKLYQASLSTTLINEDNLKKALTNAELRNQELKEENIKMKADLSGQVDLLLQERHAFLERIGDQHIKTWYTIERHQMWIIQGMIKNCKTIKVNLDTNDNIVKTIIPGEKLE